MAPATFIITFVNSDKRPISGVFMRCEGNSIVSEDLNSLDAVSNEDGDLIFTRTGYSVNGSSKTIWGYTLQEESSDIDATCRFYMGDIVVFEKKLSSLNLKTEVIVAH